MEIGKRRKFSTKKSQALRNRNTMDLDLDSDDLKFALELELELELESELESGSGSGSGSGSDRFGDEIWVEIISKLPCKIATQCKCVCKRWLALISDNHYFNSRFIQYHKSQSEEEFSSSSSSSSLTTMFSSLRLSKFINLFSNNNITSLDIDDFRHLNFIPKFNYEGIETSKTEFIHVLAKYRDLVLLCHDKTYQCFHDVYYVCNPLTKHWVSLPPYPFIPTLPFRGKVCVGFISCFDEDDDDVKFTVVRLDLLMSHYKVNIFSSDIGEWRELINSNLNQLSNPYPIPYPDPNPSPDQQFLVRIPGLTHSVACNGTIFFRDHMRRLIGFNVVDYHFHSIDLPPLPFVDRLGIMDMGVCRGQLRICQWIYDPFDLHTYPHFCIWELHQDFTWSLVHKLYFKDLTSNNFIPSPLLDDLRFKGVRLNAIDFHPNDGDVVHFHMCRHCIFSCNLLNKTVGLLLSFKIDDPDIYSPPVANVNVNDNVNVNVNVINQPYSRRPEPELEIYSVMPPYGFGRAYQKVYHTGAVHFLDHLLWPTPLPKVLRRRRKQPSSSSSTNSSKYVVVYTDFDKIPQLIQFTKIFEFG